MFKLNNNYTSGDQIGSLVVLCGTGMSQGGCDKDLAYSLSIIFISSAKIIKNRTSNEDKIRQICLKSVATLFVTRISFLDFKKLSIS